MISGQKQQKLSFVTGKGGVGKSMVASAMAYKYSQRQERVLLVELSERSYLGPLWGKSSSYSPTSIAPHLDFAQWTGVNCLREFILIYLKINKLVDLFVDNKIMQALIKTAPGLKELSILGKITSHLRHIGSPMHYDRIVVDAFASGHFRSLINVPFGMAEMISKGPMGKQSRHIHEVLSDSELTDIHIVTLAEEMPVTEALELYQDINKILGQTSQIWCNKWLPIFTDMADLQKNYQKTKNEFFIYLQNHKQSQIEAKKKLPEGFKKIPLIFDEEDKIKKIAESLNV